MLMSFLASFSAFSRAFFKSDISLKFKFFLTFYYFGFFYKGNKVIIRKLIFTFFTCFSIIIFFTSTDLFKFKVTHISEFWKSALSIGTNSHHYMFEETSYWIFKSFYNYFTVLSIPKTDYFTMNCYSHFLNRRFISSLW